MPRASHSRRHPRGLSNSPLLALLLLFTLAKLPAQTPQPQSQSLQAQAHILQTQPQSPSPARARRFAAAHALFTGAPAAPALASARAGNTGLLAARALALAADSTLAPLSAPWTPAGPAAIQSLQYGAISGRVTALALDPSDITGNTLFVGTAGGGLWKSTNAAGPTAQVTFTPLTDTLPAFSPSAGSAATPSLSIGALAALPGGLLLAGTGDPNDADDSFYGTGLLRSTDSGLTWSLITGSEDGSAGSHSFFGLGFAGFAGSSITPNLLVAALSQSEEGTAVSAPLTSSTAGLYYSADSGLTWHLSTVLDGATNVLTPLPNGNNHGGIPATAVVWNPIRQRFFAALRYHGFYQSADGITWTRLPTQPGSGLTLDACPSSGSSAACPLFRAALAVQPVTGDTFALTVDRNNQDRGLYQDTCQLSGTACTSTNPLFVNSIVSTPLDTAGIIPQADYNLTLAALPTGTSTSTPATLLFVGTSDLFRCSIAPTGSTGCILRNTTNTSNGCAAPAGVAPAQHALALGGPVAASVLYLGNDGGLWRSTDTVNQQASPCSADDSSHFQDLNLTLGSLAEVVSFAQDPTDPAILLAGLGASGTVSTGRADQTAWQQLSAGEGGTVAIDPSHPSSWYLSTAAGLNLAFCPLGSACTPGDLISDVGSTQLSGDLALLDAPSLLDPAVPGVFLAGTCRVWRGPASVPSLWSASDRVSPIFTGPQNAACSASNGFLRSLAAGGPITTSGSSVLYAGLAGTLAGGGTLGGHLFSTISAATATATTAWSDLATSSVTNDAFNGNVFNPGGYSISSLTADPHDATGHTVYATIQGFNTTKGAVPHLYRSTDAGAHWTNLSANLPGAPANALVIDPNDANTVYIALDTGVYATTTITTCATTNCWTLFGTALPNSPVTTLAAAPAMPTGDGRLGLLRAGTYGRGLWQIPLLTAATVQQPAVALSPAALTFAAQTVGGSGVVQTIIVTNTGTASLVVSRIAITSNNAPVSVTAVVTDFAETDTCTAGAVAPGATCSLSVSFLPSATGARSSTLTLYANVPGGQATASLAGTATAVAAVQLTPLTLLFPSTSLSAASPAETLVLQNTGGTIVSLASVTLTGTDFQLSFASCASTLAPGTSCTLSVVFRPGALGSRSGTVTVVDSLGTQTATLSGTATAPPTDALSSTSLTFPTTQVGSAGSPQSLILTNAGDVPLTLVTTSVTNSSTGSPDFSATNSCGNSLAAHSACAITVAFNPHTVGASTATLLVGDVYRTQTVTLSGTAVAPPGISLLPASTLTFPSTGLGATSASQLLTLTNNGGLPLLIQSVSLTGDFQLAATGSTCSVSLAPGTACTVAVVFTPTLSGLRSGALTITDNAPSSQTAPQAGLQTVPLAGTAIDFALAADGPTSITITSGKPAIFPLLLSTPANLSGTITLACTGAPANSICTLSPNTLPLGNPTPTLVTVTLATGQSITTQTASFRLPPDLSSRSRWRDLLLQSRVAHLLPAGALNLLSEPNPERATRAERRADGPVIRIATDVIFALLLPLGLLTIRRRRSLPALLALTLVAILPIVGCGSTPRQLPTAGSSATPTASATPTPPGTYTLIVSATSAGLTRSMNFVVTVQ